MSRRAAAFSQADIARALRAYRQVNGSAGAVELGSDGAVRIIPADHSPAKTTPSEPANDASDPLMKGLEKLRGGRRGKKEKRYRAASL